MEARQSQQFAEGVMSNLNGMLGEATRNSDGTPKPMSDLVWTGVLNAQSNMAIASALMWLAAELKDRR